MNMFQPDCTLAQSEEMPPPNAAAEAVDDSSSAEASRALLAELTASVEAGLAAILARDPVRLEQATREQARLQRSLFDLWTSPVWAWHEARRAELRPAGLRLLHLGRVHAALLAREQRWRNLLANLANGPASAYGSLAWSAHSARGSKCDDLNHEGSSRGEGGNPWEA